MLPLLALAGLAAAGAAGYQYRKYKDEKAKNRALADVKAGDSEEKTVAQNVYNYNYLNDSATGNTLLNPEKKTKRTLFGAGV